MKKPAKKAGQPASRRLSTPDVAYPSGSVCLLQKGEAFAMSMINCPECGKSISETACACPCCGFSLSPAVVASQKAKKQKDEKIMGAVVIGGMFIGWAMCSGVSTPHNSPSSTWSPPSTKSNYATDEARIQELGEKYYPTQGELREYLNLDAKQSVREGAMSKSDFEQFTGQAFRE